MNIQVLIKFNIHNILILICNRLINRSLLITIYRRIGNVYNRAE